MRHGIQKLIAKKAGITPAFINMIIRQGARPSWKTAKRLSSATDTDPALWLEGSPDEIVSAIEKIDDHYKVAA